MKRLLLALLLWTSLANAAITELSSQRNQVDTAGSVSSTTVAYPANVTSGNLLCVGGSAYTGTTAQTMAVTDTRSTSYTVYLADNFSNGSQFAFIACGKAPSSGSNTVTLTPSISSYIDAAITEFTGQDQTSFLDVDGSQTSNDTTTTSGVASITFSTVASNALVLGAMTHATPASISITEDGTYTKVGEQEDNSCCSAFSFIFKIVSGSGSQTPSWTIGNTSGYQWYVYAISVKPAIAAAGVHHKAMVFQ